jgi:hypothetical protein
MSVEETYKTLHRGDELVELSLGLLVLLDSLLL